MAIPDVPETLPKRRTRRFIGGAETAEISVHLETVTPILGGSPRLRSIDEVDVIRVPTIRGHLRFWWRALYGHRYSCSRDLIQAEGALWGISAGNSGGRSKVEVSVVVVSNSTIDKTDINLTGQNAVVGAYAIWPARKTPESPTAPRRRPGVRFNLKVVCPASLSQEVENSVRAWILFGGYGSRTRRGLGSLTVLGEDRRKWLPAEASLQAFTELFNEDIFSLNDTRARDLPELHGAILIVGSENMSDSEKAWVSGVEVLRDFRQGTHDGPGNRAREPDPAKGPRPSISNWPEPDKIRQLIKPPPGRSWSHAPRYNERIAWPRAGFGLPIIGQFQRKSRDEGSYNEPPNFQLTWQDHKGVTKERLASPLIVKALPLSNGQFLPCVLWLSRSYPAGVVVLKDTEHSEAPFDKLLGEGDVSRFNPLSGKTSLRQAFTEWLISQGGRKVTP